MAKAKAQTGLSIKRNGAKFTCSWKLGETYDAQFITISTKDTIKKNTVWTPDIKAKTKEYTVKVDTSKYFPNKNKYISAVMFSIRGTVIVYKKVKKKGKDKNGKAITTITKVAAETKISDPASKTFTIYAPKAPSVGVSLTAENQCSFSWSVADAGSGSNYWFNRVVWESILLEDNNETDGNKLASYFTSGNSGWKTGTSTSSANSVPIREESELLTDKSYTRWFRVRSEGAAGWSKWKYGKYVYAQPKQAVIDAKNTKGVKNNAGGIDATVTWTLDTPASRPVNSVEVQYVLATPAADLSCPSGITGWQTFSTILDTSKSDGTKKSINAFPGEDQCMYVRVNAIHDYRTKEGAPYRIYNGYLKSPTDLSVSLGSNHTVTVSAQNASTVPGTFLVVRYVSDNEPKGFNIAVIPNGQQSVIIQCPDWGTNTPTFGVYAVAGSYRQQTRQDGITSYSITERMRSDGIVTEGGALPNIPQNVSAQPTSTLGTISVSWSWSWAEADSAELSWADHADAWTSTDQPNTYIVEGNFNSQWNIAGLETGKVWYVRVRLLHHTSDNNIIYGGYSELNDDTTVNLSSAPAIPELTVSPASIVTEEDTITASWGYTTTDGTLQAYAVLAEVTEEEGQLVYTEIAHTATAQHLSFNVKDVGWEAGEQHGIAVRTTSASGHESDDWSAIYYINVAEKLEISITNTSLVIEQVYDDEYPQEPRTVQALKEMPLTVTVDGAGTASLVSVYVERYDEYKIERPDETELDGYLNETIALETRTGNGSVEISQESLIGRLDDGALYRIVATARDDLGQTARAVIEPFEVRWTNQAIIPNATILIDDSTLSARLMPVAPTGYREEDVCDIYRLSVDKPVLIYEGASWGTWYVDPYPTIGYSCGYRFVYRTAEGDYITEDNELAWVDVYDSLRETEYNIIDFGSDRVVLTDNVDLSSTWEKDFEETKYLGGSVQGDWNPAVSRNSDIGAVLLTLTDSDTIEAMRRLAEYTGICHVRTKDGSTYTADVQVSEDRSHNTGHMVVSFSLEITRVQNERLDGMTYEEWLALRSKG